MNTLRRQGLILFIVVTGASIAHGEPRKTCESQHGCTAKQCWCPDDYCRKAPPRIACLPPCCEHDCYQRKPMPCLPCLGRGECDDYCGKPLPCITPLSQLGGICVPFGFPSAACAKDALPPSTSTRKTHPTRRNTIHPAAVRRLGASPSLH